jgi:hypothetical protein
MIMTDKINDDKTEIYMDRTLNLTEEILTLIKQTIKDDDAGAIVKIPLASLQWALVHHIDSVIDDEYFEHKMDLIDDAYRNCKKILRNRHGIGDKELDS